MNITRSDHRPMTLEEPQRSIWAHEDWWRVSGTAVKKRTIGIIDGKVHNCEVTVEALKRKGSFQIVQNSIRPGSSDRRHHGFATGLKKLRDCRCNKSGRDTMAAHIEHVKTDIVFTGIVKIKNISTNLFAGLKSPGKADRSDARGVAWNQRLLNRSRHLKILISLSLLIS